MGLDEKGREPIEDSLLWWSNLVEQNNAVDGNGGSSSCFSPDIKEQMDKLTEAIRQIQFRMWRWSPNKIPEECHIKPYTWPAFIYEKRLPVKENVDSTLFGPDIASKMKKLNKALKARYR